MSGKYGLSKSVDCTPPSIQGLIPSGDLENLEKPFGESEAYAFADDLMRRAFDYADLNAREAIDLAGDIEGYVPRGTEVQFPRMRLAAIDFNKAMNYLNDLLDRMANKPVFRSISQDLASLRDLDRIPDIVDVDFDDFTGVAPDLEFPPAPIFAIGDQPLPSPIIYPTVPPVPSWIEPDLPIFQDITIPSVPVIDIPTFDAILVDEEILAPTTRFEFNEVEYSSALLNALRTTLLDDILNGGYGIEESDEILMWQRAREREQMALNQAVEEATREWTASGFTMPPGAMIAAVNKANNMFIEKTSSMNREQTLEHSNKYWDGKKFTIAQAKEFEQMLITYHSAVMERALNAAKAQVEVSVNLFNAHVAAFKARHERYQVIASVFETRVRAELAKVEIYKAQIEGMTALVTMNRSLVELYNAQLDGIKNLVDRYRTQVEAYNILANVEKLKTDIFRAEVEAFLGTVQAKEAEFKAYEAAIRGQIARVDAYRAEAEAYRAVTDGKKAVVDASRSEIEAYVSKNRGVIDAFEAESKSLDSLRTAQLQYNQNLTQIYAADVQRFAAEADAAGKAYDMSSKYEEIEYRVENDTLQMNIENAKNQLYRLLEISKIRLESLRAAADVHRSLAAAALSAINCNASLSESMGYNVSKSGNISKSYGFSESKSVAQQCGLSYSEGKSYNMQDSWSEARNDTHQTSDSYSDNYNTTWQYSESEQHIWNY